MNVEYKKGPFDNDTKGKMLFEDLNCRASSLNDDDIIQIVGQDYTGKSTQINIDKDSNIYITEGVIRVQTRNTTTIVDLGGFSKIIIW